jgi:hypothetical protein
MSSTITTRLDEDQEPEDGSAGVARSEPGGRAHSDALALRAVRTPTRSLIGSRSCCLTS